MNPNVTTRKIGWAAVLVAVLSFCAFFTYGLVEMFRPKDVSKLSPQGMFRWLVCDPMPPSVTNIKATGSILFTGHSVEMQCEIAPADFNLALTQGGFVFVDNHRAQQSWSTQLLASIPKPEFYQKRGGDFDSRSRVLLLAPTNHDRLFIQYFRP